MTSKLVSTVGMMAQAPLQNLLSSEVLQALTNFNMATTSEQLAQLVVDFHGRDLFKNTNGVLPPLVEKIRHDFGVVRNIQALIDAHPKLNLDAETYFEKLKTANWADNPICQVFAQYLEIELESYLPQSSGAGLPSLETIKPYINVSEMAESVEDMDYCIYPLHDYQKLVKDEAVELLWERQARGLIHMPTGSGKTKTSVEAMVDFWRVRGKGHGVMVWFAHTRELCDQAYQTFKEVWRARGDTEITMARVFEDHAPDLSEVDNGIVFVGFQKFASLLSKNHPTALKLRDETRLVVVDEAHKALAKTYNTSISYLLENPRTRLLGLTATPGRGADARENAAFSDYFGQKRISIDYDEESYRSPIEFLQEGEYLARLKYRPIYSEVDLPEEALAKLNSSTVNLPDEILRRLSADDQRNLKIIEEIKLAVFDREDSTLVFSTSVEHAHVLKYLLGVNDIQSACVLGSTAKHERDKNIRDFKNGDLSVLINYGVLTTGFDAPILGSIVIARPTTSVILYSQMLGRALRGPNMGGKNKVNTVINLVDNAGKFGDETAAFNYFKQFFDDEEFE